MESPRNADPNPEAEGSANQSQQSALTLPSSTSDSTLIDRDTTAPSTPIRTADDSSAVSEFDLTSRDDEEEKNLGEPTPRSRFEGTKTVWDYFPEDPNIDYENWSHINPPMSKVDLESDQFEMIKSSRKPFNGNKEFRILLIWGFREGVYKNTKLYRFFNPFMKEHGLVVAMDRVLMLGSIRSIKTKVTKSPDDDAKKASCSSN